MCSDGTLASDRWIVDSGATTHISGNKQYFVSYKPFAVPQIMYSFNGECKSKALGQGHIEFEAKIGQSWVRSRLENVWYVPDAKHNLFSIRCAVNKGHRFAADDKGCVFTCDKEIVLTGQLQRGLYLLNIRMVLPVGDVVYFASHRDTMQLWHERLGHQNKRQVKRVLSRYGVDVSADNEFCDGCALGKSHRQPFGTRPNRTEVIGELINADVCGPMETTSLGGNRYFVLFKDDCSKYRQIFFVKRKNEVAECFRIFVKEAKTAGHTVKELMCDNGGEFLSRDTRTVANEFGITLRTTAPYCPEQNGAVERENRTVVEAARTMLQAHKLPTFLWGEACYAAVYLLNLTGPTPVVGKSPLELWSGRTVSDLSHLRVFGTECYVHMPKEEMGSKKCHWCLCWIPWIA